MRIKKILSKKGIERLLNKGLAQPIPYSDYIAVHYEKQDTYELYKPIKKGKKYLKVEDIRYFQE